MGKKSFDKFHNDELLQNIFNAIPAFVFIVDADVRLLFWNAKAEQLVGERRDRVYLKRGGDAVQCVHSFETPAGCGAAGYCTTCPIRNSVTAALRDRKACRAFTRMQLSSGDTTTDVYLLVNASPFLHQKKDYVLLILEDVSHVIALEEAQGHLPKESEAPQDTALLSTTERAVLKWLKVGKSSWDISQILKISERTVNFHIYNVIQKLDAMNRTHAVAIAMEKGLLPENGK